MEGKSVTLKIISHLLLKKKSRTNDNNIMKNNEMNVKTNEKKRQEKFTFRKDREISKKELKTM